MPSTTDPLTTAPWTQAFAPAKINLSLHVTGQRADGYHLLDSLVGFADLGDNVRLRRADQMSLRVTGPCAAGVPSDARNLVWRAAEWFGTPPVEIELEKHLPAAAGIGGGSADAAATLRALSELYKTPMPAPAELEALGADIPVCLPSQPARLKGVGGDCRPVGNVPSLPMVLVNPGHHLATPDVFGQLAQKSNPPMPAAETWPRDPATWLDWLDWLAAQRNDLEAAAIALCPQIAEVLQALRALPGCKLARMSGSGATCFALFGTPIDADAFGKQHPDWWVAGTRLKGSAP